jgi:hypothetical protein
MFMDDIFAADEASERLVGALQARSPPPLQRDSREI